MTTMRLNTIAPVPGSVHEKKRVGRGIGSGLGKTAGRGHKGQKSRSGGRVRPGFEGGQMPLQKRVPKYGFYSRIGAITAEVRTSELGKVEGDTVNLQTLEKADIIDRNTQRVKVMLSGDVTRALTVEGIRVSKGARAAIEAAGGKVIDPVEDVKSRPKARPKKAAPKQEAAADQAASPESDSE